VAVELSSATDNGTDWTFGIQSIAVGPTALTNTDALDFLFSTAAGTGGGSSTLAGLTDVTLSGVAQGDMFYRGATEWNNTPNLNWDETNDILRVGALAGNHLIFDGGDPLPFIQAQASGVSDDLQLNPNGSSVRVGSASAAGGFNVYNSGGVVGFEVDTSGNPTFRSTSSGWAFEVFNSLAELMMDWSLSSSAINQLDFYNNGSATVFRGEPTGGGALLDMMSLDPNGTKTFYYNGDIALTLTINEAQLRSNTLGNDPTTGGVQNVSYVLQNSGGAQLGRLGYLTQSTLQLTNDVHGGLIQLRAEDSTGDEHLMIQADPDDDVKLYDVDIEVARTLPAASGGFEVNNTLTGAGFERVLTTSDLGGGGGNVSNTGTPVDNQIAVWTDATTIEGTTALTFDGTTLDVVGAANIDHDNSANDADTYIYNRNSIGGMALRTWATLGIGTIYQTSNTGTLEDIWISMARNGTVELYHNGAKKVQTTSTGININSGSGGNVDLAIQAGTTNLVAIDMWNGSNGGLSMEMIAGSSGDFRIAQTSAGNSFQDAWVRFYRDGEVELYHNNIPKLATTANGIDVSGTLIALDTGALSDGEMRILTALGGVGIVVDGSTTGRLDILQTTSVGAVEDTWIRAARNGAVSLFHNNAERIETTTSGINVIGPTGQGTIELTGIASNDANLLVQNGNGGFRANVEAATGDFELWQTSNVGADEDLWIYGDRDGAVSLYFNGVLTAQTGARRMQILSDATTPATAGSLLEWLGSDAARWGWAGFGLTSDTFRIENERHGGLLQLAGEDTATGTPQLVFQGDPDAEVILYYAGIQAFSTRVDGIRVQDTSGNDPLMRFYDDAGTILSRVQHLSNSIYVWNETDGNEVILRTDDSAGTSQNHLRVGTNATGTAVGFHSTAPIAKPTVTGSRGGNAALASLLTALANYGLITDSST
jgi:hypothetical protein